MPSIAISYRRADSAGTTGRIFDKLVSHFGDDSVFMDVDKTPLGIDYREHVRTIISESDVVLAVIGPRWLDEENKKRIDDARDLVRIEIQTALESGVPLIPVLVDHARMPSADDLPDQLKDFSFRNAAEVGPGRDFHVHMDRLTRSINGLLERRAVQALTAAPTHEPSQQSDGSLRGMVKSDAMPSPLGSSDGDDASPHGLMAIHSAPVARQGHAPDAPADLLEAPRSSRLVIVAAVAGAVLLLGTGGLLTYRIAFVPEQPLKAAGDRVPQGQTAHEPPAGPQANPQDDASRRTATSLPVDPAPPSTTPVKTSPTPQIPIDPRKVKTVPIRPDETSSLGGNSNVAANGSFVVQVASQRSEADAQASYRALQAKYPMVLGDREASIRKADLGDKGVFYRAQLGPFTTLDQANELCVSLKTAGGQCVVQKN
jgi:SPOR domain/TIR domain